MEKKFNILFIHEVSYLTKPIFEMHEFPELLAKRGHKVSFLQFNEGFKFWNQPRAPKAQIISGRVHPESNIQLHTPFQLGIPGLDRLFVMVSFIPLFLGLLSRNKYDVIVQLAVPTYGLQTNLIARAKGVPIVFRALDVSHKIRKTPFSGLIKLAEKRVYKGATLISANNPAMGEYCKYLGQRSSKSIVNVPPLDMLHFKSQQPDLKLRATLGIKAQDSVITYMGSFFYFSGLKQVIDSFAQKKPQNAKLLIIGGGEHAGELTEQTKRLGLEKEVIFTGFIPYIDLPKYFSISTVAINPMVPGLVSNTAFPHKVLQYIAAGLPVVSTKLEGLLKTFGQASGITWTNSPEEILTAALELVEDAEKCEKNAAAQKTIAERIFGIEQALLSFETTLKEAVRQQS